MKKAKLRLTKADLKLLRWACEIATQSEHELIDAHHDSLGRCFDKENVADSRKTIRKLKLLRARITEFLLA